jgi:Mrp family chromosome partitioning ATPase/capsular polysaccharide biosynthesis protein
MSDFDSPLHRKLLIAKREAWLIVLAPIVALVIGAYLVSRQPSMYRASMSIVVAQAGGGLQPVVGSQQLSQTMKNLLESDVVASGVIQDRRLQTTPNALLKHIHVSFSPDSSVLRVTYDSPRPQEAVSVLRSIGAVFKDLVDKQLGIRSGPSVLQNSTRVPLIVTSIFDPAHLDPGRVSPKPGKTYTFAGILGLVLGLLLAFARESFDDRLRGREEVEGLGLPVAGAVPKGSRSIGALKGGSRRDGYAGEAFDVLRANVEFSRLGLEGAAIVVTSAGPDEGKSTVAGNLAAAFARAGKHVVCVEADIERPRLHRYLAVPIDRPGLIDVLAGQIEVEEALQEVPMLSFSAEPQPRSTAPGEPPSSVGTTVGTHGRLQVLTAGRARPPRVLLSTPAIAGLVERLRGRADYVIFDSPPLSVANALPLALAAEAVLVVVRAGRTTRRDVHAARTTLEGLGIANFGVVVTDAPRREPYGYA